MTICFVTVCRLSPSSGGVDRVCVNIISELQRLQHKVISCYINGDDRGEHGGIYCYRFPNSQRITSSENREMLRDVITKHEVDIVWDNSCYIDLNALCATTKLGAKVVYTLHSEPLSQLKSKRDDLALLNAKGGMVNMVSLLKAIVLYPIGCYLRRKSVSNKYRQIYNQSNAFTLLSESFVDEFVALTHLKETSKLYAINNPIHCDGINVDLVSKKRQIVFCGRLVWQKRLDRLLRVWAIVQDRLPEWSVVVLGKGPDRGLYEDMARKLKLRRVEFLGERGSKPCFLESSVVCMTSTYEGFGMVLVEAQQVGCVPMAFNSYGAINDIIEDGVTGMIVNSFSIKQYASKLYELCQDHKQREQMAQNGMESAKRFDSTIIVNRWLELFEKLKGKNE